MHFLFVWAFTLIFGVLIIKQFKKWKDLPPGPWGFPIIGYLPFINRKYPHLTLTELAKKYGPIYSFSMGSVFTVVLSDHKLIRDAFSKDSFSGRAPLFLTHGIMRGFGIIGAEGPRWKDQRKLITTWLKSFGMSKHSVARDKLEKRIASGIYELLQNIKESSGKPINLPQMITDSLGSIVNDIIFGCKFPPNDKTWKWLRNIQEEGCHEMGVAGAVNFLPFLRFFQSSVKRTMDTLVRGQNQSFRLYEIMIQKRREMLGLKKIEDAAYPPHDNLFVEYPEGRMKCIAYSKDASDIKEHYFDPNDLILSEDVCITDSFLLEQKKRFEANEESSKYMTDEQMMFLLADMFGAGLDTSVCTFAWYMLFMSLYPEEQEKVRREIMTVSPDESDVDASKLPYMMATICETQRIRSIVPLGIPHGTTEETYLNGHRIPKGTMVVPLMWAIHMDPQIWKDPNEFRPSRFIGEDGSLLKPQEFIPFQTGKRMCPGDELSRMVSLGLVTRVLKSVRIRLASKPPSQEELLGIVGITLCPPKVEYICEPL